MYATRQRAKTARAPAAYASACVGTRPHRSIKKRTAVWKGGQGDARLDDELFRSKTPSKKEQKK